MMLTLFATLCASLAVFVGVGAVSGQFSFSNRRLAARTITLQRGDTKPRKDKKSIILKDDDFGGSPFVTSLLRKSGWAARRAVMLDRADVALKVSEYVLVLMALFVGLWLVVSLTSGYWFIGLGAGVVGVLGGEFWLRSRMKRRSAKFNKQLPIALQVMATSLKSGFGIMEAVGSVSREMDAPLSTEFARILDEARLGGSFEAGLTAMVDRIDSNDLRIVARAIEIHRKVGGDLAAILESVAGTMREREELRGHIIALTAQQRFGGMVVGALPIWIAGFFLVVDPKFISPLWTDTAGRIILVIAISMEIVAVFAMRKVMAIEV